MTLHDTNKSLVAVVVTCNRLDKLQVTLARLLDSPADELLAIVLVDNASTDGTDAWLNEQTDDRLVVLREETNTGGAGGFYRGMKEAVSRFDPDWLVVMDDDGRPEVGALANFQALDVAEWDGMAAAVYFPSGEICEMNRPSRNPFWHLREFFGAMLNGRGGFHIRPEAYSRSEPSPIDVTSFVGFFISRRGLEIAGYPDPKLFIYGDDGIYTLGLSEMSGKMCFEPRIRFEHDLSTFTAQRGRFHPMWKIYYYHRNLLMLYRLAAGVFFWPALLFIIPKWLFKIRDHKDDRALFLSLMLRAIRDGILRRRDVRHTQVLEWAQGK
ncbi:glycosyltransferase [Falsihalocynthiibacter sp. SS001]|uniref:glycosyltransferase n=1 Tax=Falsihalocynthiibacter sp. SS001 TaxID=3349698 RepID=UPI0036D311E1